MGSGQSNESTTKEELPEEEKLAKTMIQKGSSWKEILTEAKTERVARFLIEKNPSAIKDIDESSAGADVKHKDLVKNLLPLAIERGIQLSCVPVKFRTADTIKQIIKTRHYSGSWKLNQLAEFLPNEFKNSNSLRELGYRDEDLRQCSMSELTGYTLTGEDMAKLWDFNSQRFISFSTKLKDGSNKLGDSGSGSVPVYFFRIEDTKRWDPEESYRTVLLLTNSIVYVQEAGKIKVSDYLYAGSLVPINKVKQVPTIVAHMPNATSTTITATAPEKEGTPEIDIHAEEGRSQLK